MTIAGSDSGGGAGIQADLKTFAAHGVFGTSAITAITAQNTMGVTAAQALSADLVTAQIEAVAADIHIHATKTGMLATAAIVEAVAAAITELELPLVVVDPVMLAKSGDALLDEDAVMALRNELLPRALVVTPNIPEAEVFGARRLGARNQCEAVLVALVHHPIAEREPTALRTLPTMAFPLHHQRVASVVAAIHQSARFSIRVEVNGPPPLAREGSCRVGCLADVAVVRGTRGRVGRWRRAVGRLWVPR